MCIRDRVSTQSTWGNLSENISEMIGSFKIFFAGEYPKYPGDRILHLSKEDCITIGDLKKKYSNRAVVKFMPHALIFKLKGEEEGPELPDRTSLDDLLNKDKTYIVAYSRNKEAFAHVKTQGQQSKS
eukprot:TRINITY_DN973_c0_g2_i2.p1 TRINITY_DN973_c0_g2~~TRINITY_DN973_c0_g2_i2.p1  ORF type:complete len:127 (+),score=26.35 TRINITY_DN973_c0_g2_i2:65-445(+)